MSYPANCNNVFLVNVTLKYRRGDPCVVSNILGFIIRQYFLIITVLAFLTAGYLIFVQLKGFRFEKRAVTLDNGDVSEAVAPVGKNIFSRLIFGIRLPSHPVRRAFYKKVRKHRDLVKKSDTAAEMAVKIKDKEDIDELTGEYEKVRYN